MVARLMGEVMTAMHAVSEKEENRWGNEAKKVTPLPSTAIVKMRSLVWLMQEREDGGAGKQMMNVWWRWMMDGSKRRGELLIIKSPAGLWDGETGREAKIVDSGQPWAKTETLRLSQRQMAAPVARFRSQSARTGGWSTRAGGAFPPQRSDAAQGHLFALSPCLSHLVCSVLSSGNRSAMPLRARCWLAGGAWVRCMLDSTAASKRGHSPAASVVEASTYAPQRLQPANLDAAFPARTYASRGTQTLSEEPYHFVPVSARKLYVSLHGETRRPPSDMEGTIVLWQGI